jgi:hypothetical protein
MEDFDLMNTLLKRPFLNIKRIDLKGTFFVFFFMAIFLSSVMTIDELFVIRKAIVYMFTFDFYVPEVPVTEFGETVPSVLLAQDKIYEVLNVMKIVFWFITLVGVLFFLFRNPEMK